MQSGLADVDTMTKPDKSPVTGTSGLPDQADSPVADLSAQSLISLHLLAHFPDDKIIGEEDTTELRANDGLRSKVVKLVNDGFGREDGWEKGKEWSEKECVTSAGHLAGLTNQYT